MYILATAILVGVLVVYRRNIRLEADVVGRKLAKAGRVASKRFSSFFYVFNAFDCFGGFCIYIGHLRI